MVVRRRLLHRSLKVRCILTEYIRLFVLSSNCSCVVLLCVQVVIKIRISRFAGYQLLNTVLPVSAGLPACVCIQGPPPACTSALHLCIVRIVLSQHHTYTLHMQVVIPGLLCFIVFSGSFPLFPVLPPAPAHAQVVILGLLCFIVFSLDRRDLSSRLG